MPGLWQVTKTAKARAFGPADALDVLNAPKGVRAGRVAGDELLWIGDAGTIDGLLQSLRQQLAVLGNRAAVVDHSDGYALFTLTGARRGELFARLSSLRIPAAGGFLQGSFAGVPSRVFCSDDRIEVIVTSDVAWFVGSRLEHVEHSLASEGAA